MKKILPHLWGLFVLIVVALAMTACQKNSTLGLVNQDCSNHLLNQIHKYLNETAQKSGSKRANRLQFLTANILKDEASLGKLQSNEKLLLLPLRKFKSSDSYLLCFFSGNDSLIRIQMMDVSRETSNDQQDITAELICDLIDNTISITSAKLVVSTIFDKMLIEFDFDESAKLVTKEWTTSSIDKLGRSTDSECTNWYLVTTTYYADGHTEVDWEFLGCFPIGSCLPNELCDELDGGGGSGSGEEYFEYSVATTHHWTVYEGVNNTVQVHSREKLKGKKVAGEPQGGHFTSITHDDSYIFMNVASLYKWYENGCTVTASGQTATASITGRLVSIVMPRIEISNAQTSVDFSTAFP